MPRILISIAILVLLACHQKEKTSYHFPKGGYPYADSVPPGDSGFYLYPLRNMISKTDSVRAVIYAPQYFQAFDEPNLSLRPPDKPVVRLSYDNSFLGYYSMITLHDQQLVVKEIIAKTLYDYDDSLLSQKERWHLNLIQTWYPFSDTTTDIHRKKYFDSLLTLYPQLKDPEYLVSLLNKKRGKKPECISQRIWTVPLTADQSQNLLDSINNSGFWQLKYNDDSCTGLRMDGDGFTLEVAAPAQYNIVISRFCEVSLSGFDHVCKKIMEISGMKKSLAEYLKKNKPPVAAENRFLPAVK